MFKKVKYFILRFFNIYSQKRITRSSAALSYYLTMTVFPLLICLYTMLGSNYDAALRIVKFSERFFAEETGKLIEGFMNYVAAHNSRAMFIAGASVVVTSSSAAVRSIQVSIGDMQGGQRFSGLIYFLFSVLFSLAFVLMVYFGALVLITGRTVINKINTWLPFIDISQSWHWLRFVFLFAFVFLIIWIAYMTSKRREDKYDTFVGAMVSSTALVGVSIAFSVFIGASARYPLVYGSLTALILLMLWMYFSCMVIFCGAAVNIALRDTKEHFNLS